MNKQIFEDWIQGYLKAWTSNDPADIAALFTEEAEYHPAPFTDPWVGQETITKEWIALDDQPGTWTFDHDWLAIEGDTGVLHALTTYTTEGTFSNIWVVKLNKDGRCYEFREWLEKKGI
jgi:hypothetical protein